MIEEVVGPAPSESLDEDNKSDSTPSSVPYESTVLHVHDFEKLLEFYKYESFAQGQLFLREYVLCHGIHGEGLSPPSDSLRSKVWKLLLGVPSYFDVDSYLAKSEDANAFDPKITDDVFRTFRGNEDFWKKVDTTIMTKVLRATAVDYGYVQGMNVLVAPFLYIMPELDSYYCFHTLLSDHLLSYCNKNLLGVHKGVQLVNRCLLLLDPDLHSHILSKIPDMTILSVRFLMTLMANVQPLSEVLQLWDRIFAMGVHCIILVFCAHLMKLRGPILEQNTGYKISMLIEQSALETESLMKIVLSLIPRIPSDLMEELLIHTTFMYNPSQTSFFANNI